MRAIIIKIKQFKSQNPLKFHILLFAIIVFPPVIILLFLGKYNPKDIIIIWLTLWSFIFLLWEKYSKKSWKKNKKNFTKIKKYDNNNYMLSQKIEHTQSETTTIKLCNESYYKNLELLKTNNEVIRNTSINNLYALAKQYPEQYKNQVCNIFCDLVKCYSVRNTDSSVEMDPSNPMPKFIQLILNILFKSHESEYNIFYECHKNLNNCILHRIVLKSAKINNTSFNNTQFINCSFHKTEITNSNLVKASFKSCVFRNSEFKHSNFYKSILSNVTLDTQNMHNLQFSDSKIFNSQFRLVQFDKDSFDNSTFNRVMFNSCIFQPDVILTGVSMNNVVLTFRREAAIPKFMELLPENLRCKATLAPNNITINPNSNFSPN